MTQAKAANGLLHSRSDIPLCVAASSCFLLKNRYSALVKLLKLPAEFRHRNKSIEFFVLQHPSEKTKAVDDIQTIKQGQILLLGFW